MIKIFDLGNFGATIEIDASKFDREISRAENKLKSFSLRTGSLGQSISNLGSTLTKKITMPALTAASALASVTMVKGFNRLVGIDTAQAKLKALGHDAKTVESIMESALDSVKGTAFGLDEAATTAANAIAAGIPVGKELTRYLSITGDAAAIAGASLGEMGSIVNKVTTAGKAYNGELQQLSDRGLPIYQWLAEEANTTADAIFNMASQGQISSEMLLNAIENNIGGAAKIMGEESFSAAIKNIGADIARIGAAFLDAGGEAGGFFSTVKPLLTDFRGFLDELVPKAAELGVKFGQAFNDFVNILIELKARFDSLDPSIQSFLLNVVTIGSTILIAIGPALKIVGGLVTAFSGLAPVITFLSNPITLIVAAIGGLVAALIYAYNESQTFREIVNQVFNQVSEIVTTILATLTEYIQEKLNQILQFWNENGENIMQATENIFSVIKEIFEFYFPILEAIVLGAWEIITSIFDTAINVILGLVKWFASLLAGDFEGMKEAAIEIWEALWNGVKGILEGAWNLLSGAFGALWKNISDWFSDLKDSAIEWGKNFIDGFIEGMKSMGQAVANAAAEVVKKAGEFLKFWSPAKKGEGRYIVHWGRNMIDGFLDGVRQESKKAGKVINDMIKSMSPKALDYTITPSGTLTYKNVTPYMSTRGNIIGRGNTTTTHNNDNSHHYSISVHIENMDSGSSKREAERVVEKVFTSAFNRTKAKGGKIIR